MLDEISAWSFRSELFLASVFPSPMHCSELPMVVRAYGYEAHDVGVGNCVHAMWMSCETAVGQL